MTMDPVSSASQTSRIELDPELYERRKEEGLFRLNVVRNSVVRAIAFPLFAVLVVGHNLLLSIDTPIWVLITLVSYPVLAWILVRSLYRSWPGIAEMLLMVDLGMAMIGIYGSGGERSLLFFLPLARVIDQSHTGMKRTLAFGHLTVGFYLALILLLDFVVGREVSWGAESIKIASLYIASLYTASVARAADSKRRRLVSAVDVARQAADDLERAMHRNELILESAGVGIVGVDSNGLVVFANTRALDTVGLTRDETIGRRGHDLARHRRSDGTFCDGTNCVFLATLESRDEQQGEHPALVRHDGRTIPVEFTSAPIIEGGVWTGAVFAFRDISERKQMEREILAARDAAESANRAKSRFLATMSHELRTPLNAILGYGEMLDEELSEAGRDDLLPDLRRIRSSGKQLLAMIDDLLEIAKLETGDVDLEAESIDLVALGRELEDVMSAACAERGNTFTLHPVAPARFGSDTAKVRRILLHLLGNANKFTEKGAVALQIETSNDAQQPSILFRVTDTGIGMSKEAGRNVFEAFRQGDETMTRKHDGAGVGLTIARRLAQLMGGEISVTSIPGEGSTFTLRLPTQT